MRALAASAAALAAGAAFAAPAAAQVEPVAPQPGSACGSELADALTRTADRLTVLRCSGGSWQPLDDPYPHSDRWVSYGDGLTLHGEAQRNRELDSGDWLATPLEPGTRCAAAQTAIADTGSLGPPKVSTGEPGSPLAVEIAPLLFTVDLSGYCRWDRR